MTDESLTAAYFWNPDLHPRGNDGKFIEVGGLVKLFNFKEGGFGKTKEGRGKVKRMIPGQEKGNPDIEVELENGKLVTVKPEQLESLEVKAELGRFDPDLPRLSDKEFQELEETRVGLRKRIEQYRVDIDTGGRDQRKYAQAHLGIAEENLEDIEKQLERDEQETTPRPARDMKIVDTKGKEVELGAWVETLNEDKNLRRRGNVVGWTEKGEVEISIPNTSGRGRGYGSVTEKGSNLRILKSPPPGALYKVETGRGSRLVPTGNPDEAAPRVFTPDHPDNDSGWGLLEAQKSRNYSQAQADYKSYLDDDSDFVQGGRAMYSVPYGKKWGKKRRGRRASGEGGEEMEAVDLYLEWEEALNEPEIDVLLVASLESQAESAGLDLWQINNRLLNSIPHGVTAAFWNPLLHPRGWGGRFVEVGDLVGFFRGGEEERGTVRAIKPDGKLVVELDRRGGGVNVRAMTVDPRDVRPLGVKGFLRGQESRVPSVPEPSNVIREIREKRYADVVARMREGGVSENRIPDFDRWNKSDRLPPEGEQGWLMRDIAARRAEREGRLFDPTDPIPRYRPATEDPLDAQAPIPVIPPAPQLPLGETDRPFSNLSDDELQQAYQNTVNRLIQDVDDQSLMDSLELDVDYFREEFERRGIPRVGIGSRYQESEGDRPFANLSDAELRQTYQSMVNAMIGDIDPQLLESLELDRDYILEEFSRRGIPRIASSGSETSFPTDFPEDFPPDTLVDFRTKGVNARGYVVGAEDSDRGEDALLYVKSGNEIIPRRVRNVAPAAPLRPSNEELTLSEWFQQLRRMGAPAYATSGMVAVLNVPWNPDLHPRGRDGKFIETLGVVRLFDFMDRRGNRHSEGIGRVTDITPDRSMQGNPDIEVELPEGGHVTVKPNQIASAPQIKGRLEGESRAPTLEEAEDLLDIEAGERLVAPPEEQFIPESPQYWVEDREVGNLMVGDEIILPGDIPGQVVSFEFPGDRPDSVRVHTDGGTYHGKTTDILPSYREGDVRPERPTDDESGEINPIGEPVTAAPGEPGSKDNPIHTADALEAVKALRDGKYVELESVDQVSTLLNELADIAADAKAKGEEAPTYDLCLVSVPGTNLFCAESKGVPRINMPQLSGFPTPGSKADALPRTEEGGVDIGPAFMEHLRSQGVGVTEERRLASHLKASQSELIGSKIAGMMRAMDGGNEFAIRNIRENPIFVTSDGYVIDGHHRWASVVGWDALEGDLDDYDMPVRVIDMDIMDVLSEANTFANDFGIPQVSSSDVGPEIKQVNPPTESESFRARNVDLDLAAEIRAKYERDAIAERTRMNEMSRVE